MDANFWHDRWQKNEIPFHEKQANPLLVNYFARLQLEPGSRIFVPLCGKTLDIHWLLANGHRVVGAELSELAVQQLFQELGISPTIQPMNGLIKYSAAGIDVFVGDLFSLTKEQLGPVDAIYDRAALIALPEPVRVKYAAHLKELTASAPQLLATLEYDQSTQHGPPFSVDSNEVRRHYGESYAVTLLASQELVGGLRARCEAMEHVWLLSRV
ncbi:thiopurine S-methyltransferase [Planctomicrobium piriforme]|uniref:Thiopurine S-methyltransferase n=1 Tax=Planctomicrobium piriforme TaxID=1576369 RepID=A0A1I3B0N2_9PLAN|nr:thiopurine S-methyltransferase [Planctomicrobium piriforme]SFH55844.1 thiopurine S-methyltransferase [Planctomicrobium piriforme]